MMRRESFFLSIAIMLSNSSAPVECELDETEGDNKDRKSHADPCRHSEGLTTLAGAKAPAHIV
jgi:hypothetical protein